MNKRWRSDFILRSVVQVGMRSRRHKVGHSDQNILNAMVNFEEQMPKVPKTNIHGRIWEKKTRKWSHSNINEMLFEKFTIFVHCNFENNERIIVKGLMMQTKVYLFEFLF